MRVVLVSLVTLLVVVAVAALALPWVVPQPWLQATLEERLEAAAGRPVEIGGPVELRMIPKIEAVLRDVTVADEPAGTAPHLLEAERIRAQLAPLALLQGRVDVRRLLITGLALNLEIDAAGEPNWRLEASAEPGAPPAFERGDDAGATDRTPDVAVTLADVRLVDGEVRFADAQTGISRAFTDIDGDVAMPALDAPLTVDLDGRLDNRPLSVSGRLATMAKLMAGQPFDADLDLASQGSEAGYAGTARLAPQPGLDGTLTVDLQKAPSTLSWLAGQSVTVPVQHLRLETAIAGNVDNVAMDSLRVEIAGTEATGRLALELASGRPRLAGELAAGTLELGPVAALDASGADAAKAPAGTGRDTSRAPLDMAPLPLDVDLDVTFEGLVAPPLTLGAGDLALRGEGGDLRVEVASLELYDGSATGEVRLTPKSPGVGIASSLTLRSVRTEPIAKMLTDGDFLDGTGDLDLEVRATGTDAATLMASLAGGGNFTVEKAVLRGLADEPALEALRTLLALGGEPGEPIALADLEASFRIDEGVLRNDDLAARASALALSGAGAVDLADRRVPGYTLTPSARGPLANVPDIARLLIPVVISGPFSDLQVRPAPDASIDPSLDAVTEALERAQEKAAQGDLEGAAKAIIEEGLGDVLRGFGISP